MLRYRSADSGLLLTVVIFTATWRKPAPGMFLQALKDFGVAATDALMIGDLNADRDAAKAAGIPFQWAKNFFQAEVPV